MLALTLQAAFRTTDLGSPCLFHLSCDGLCICPSSTCTGRRVLVLPPLLPEKRTVVVRRPMTLSGFLYCPDPCMWDGLRLPILKVLKESVWVDLLAVLGSYMQTGRVELMKQRLSDGTLITLISLVWLHCMILECTLHCVRFTASLCWTVNRRCASCSLVYTTSFCLLGNHF